MQFRHFAALLAVLSCWLMVLAGCNRTDEHPQLLTVLDLTPREVDLGDRIEIIGVGFPEGRTARVTFKGDLHKPGRDPVKGATVTIDKATSSSSSRIDFLLTEGLQGRFAGSGDNAVHTTFRGDVVVAFDGAQPGALPVEGTIKDVELDIRAPSTARAVMQARENEGKRALEYMGIALDETQPASGGLLVHEVKKESPAFKAGVLPGDVLVRAGGVLISSRADVHPPSATREFPVEVRRGDTRRVEARVVDLSGYKGSAPSDLLGALIVLLVAFVIIGIFMSPTAGIITWVERRMAGRMQSRIGPNRTGPQGFLQWLADGIKSIVKEDIIPSQSDRPLFRLAPYLVFTGVSATFVVMPFGNYLIAADLDIGILFVVAVTSLVTIGLMTGGWASNNKWSLLGGIRSAAQIISYEIPGAIAIVCIVMMTGSLRLQDIIRAQGGPMGDWFMQGGWPWHWYMFRNPVTFLLFFLYFTTALAEGNRAPFDLPEAESELVAGYSTEYSGMRYVWFFFGEWANVFVMSGIATALFLGGWQLPGIDPGQQAASFWLLALGSFVFLLKSWFLVFVVVWVRWTLPRIRIDQMMNLCWKWFVPGSFAAFALTAVWMLWNPTGTIRYGIEIATFLVFCLLVVQFGRRVAYNIRNMQAAVHVNPFI
jgi:NADH-quinone oxidoreductase subunit H